MLDWICDRVPTLDSALQNPRGTEHKEKTLEPRPLMIVEVQDCILLASDINVGHGDILFFFFCVRRLQRTRAHAFLYEQALTCVAVSSLLLRESYSVFVFL